MYGDKNTLLYKQNRPIINVQKCPNLSFGNYGKSVHIFYWNNIHIVFIIIIIIITAKKIIFLTFIKCYLQQYPLNIKPLQIFRIYNHFQMLIFIKINSNWYQEKCLLKKLFNIYCHYRSSDMTLQSNSFRLKILTGRKI